MADTCQFIRQSVLSRPDEWGTGAVNTSNDSIHSLYGKMDQAKTLYVARGLPISHAKWIVHSKTRKSDEAIPKLLQHSVYIWSEGIDLMLWSGGWLVNKTVPVFPDAEKPGMS